ncbi:substrate-binding periplasmic protein [Pseudorhodoferax sp.]|uniref:substrate-binding periplasmic protein n=1 Tax=Pseudorhodoferax sp. TaxID=1993553 RepID=UPI002DD653D1|nr:transporter substrate-binding domain-containing protein [Pseudorhodoferax sp.]
MTRSLLPLAIALLLLPGLQAAPACTLRVRQHADDHALIRLPDGRRSGPQVETVREAARRIGCRIELLAMPWARALAELEAGRLDVLPDAHRSSEREAYAWFSASTWPSNNRLFMRVADLQAADAPGSLEAFAARRLRLGVQVGVRYSGSIDSLLASERFAGLVVRASNRQGLWQMLALGRVDGVLTDEGTGRRELPQLGLEGRVAVAPMILEGEASHTAFSRATVRPELVARFDAALEAMRRDGSAAEIEHRFRAAAERE